jgi:hypothetical protein
MGMSSERLQEAIDFIQSEKIGEAKEILLEMVKQPYPFADSWYMLMYCMPTKRQKMWCLEECLKIKPDHMDALSMLDFLDPDHHIYRGDQFKARRKNQEDGEGEETSWVVVLATVGSVLVLTAALILIFS